MIASSRTNNTLQYRLICQLEEERLLKWDGYIIGQSIHLIIVRLTLLHFQESLEFGILPS